MSPSECGQINPFFRGKEDRGSTSKAKPSGTFTITFPGTRPKDLGAMVVVSRVIKSNAAAPRV